MTVDLNEPHSRSGRYWKAEFESYHGEPGGCPDSPDGDCPEWGCVACGTALLIGLAATDGAAATATELAGRVA